MEDMRKHSERSPAEKPMPIEVSVPIGISVQKLSVVMASFNGLYKEVSKDLGVADVKDLLVNHYREGSLVIECSPSLAEHTDPLEAERVNIAVLDGLEQLKKGTRPRGFTNAALRHVARISSVAISDDITVVIGNGIRSVKCAHTLESVAKHLVDIRTMSWGSVEGTIQMISTRGSPSFNLYEVLTDERIECHFRSNLIESVKESLENRVVVYGEIHKKGDEFEYVKVEKIHRRPPSDELPGFDDIRGIFADGR